MVRSWSEEVENALKYQLEAKGLSAELAEHQRLIANMQVIIEDQETTRVELLRRTEELQTGNTWFDKWSYMQEAESKDLVNEERKRVLSHLAGMSHADTESTAFNYAARVQSVLSAFTTRETALTQSLRKEKVLREKEEKARLKLYDDVKAVQCEVKERENELFRVNALLLEEKAAKELLSIELHGLNQCNSELQEALDIKEAKYNELRSDMIREIRACTDQVAQMQRE